MRIPRLAIAIERSILQEGTSVTYSFDVVDADHLGRSVDYPQLLRLQWWLHVVITADVERIIRREIEDGVTFDVITDICGSAERSVATALAEWTDLFNRPYADEVRAGLRSQAARTANLRTPKAGARRFSDPKIRLVDPSDDGLDGSPQPVEATGTSG